MNLRQIIDRALRLTHTNINDYVDAQSVEDSNLVYQEIVDEIENNVDEDFFWDIWEVDTVIDQSEYVIEKLWVSPNDLDIRKVNKVFIKYDTNATYHTQARFLNPSALDRDLAFFEDTQPTSDPFWYIQDKSIFVYPTSSEVVTDGLRINVIHAPADLDINSAETDIEIPVQFHKVIATGIKQYIYQSQGKLNEQQVAIQDFENEKQKMVLFLRERYGQPWESVTPNLTVYE